MEINSLPPYKLPVEKWKYLDHTALLQNSFSPQTTLFLEMGEQGKKNL